MVGRRGSSSSRTGILGLSLRGLWGAGSIILSQVGCTSRVNVAVDLRGLDGLVAYWTEDHVECVGRNLCSWSVEPTE